jgi:hypothetical protein
MNHVDDLRAITRRLTIASNAGRHGTVFQEAKALVEALMRSPEDEVSAWLMSLHGQPGNVHSLCDAERALLRESGPGCTTSLGEFLEAWANEDVLDWSVYADEAAAAHTEKHAPDRRRPHVFRVYFPPSPSEGGGIVQLRVRIHPSAQAESMLWAERELANSDPVALAVALAGLDNVIEYVRSPRPALFKTGPLDRYHPERFITHHPSARALAPLARGLGTQKIKGLTMDDLNSVQSAMVADSQVKLFELPLEARLELPALGSAPIAQAASLACHMVMWKAAGRQIYDLPPALVERFRETDVDDVPLAMLKFPYDGFYLYWGPQPDMELEPGWLVDGAYVMTGVPGVLQLVVTAAPADPAAGTWWPVIGEPYYFQAFEQDTLAMDVGSAVDIVLAKELAELRARASKPAMDIDPMLHEMVANGEVDPSQVPLHIHDVSARTASQEMDRLLRRHEIYRASLTLVVNGLCYLTAYPDDSAAEYPAGAPESMVQAATSTDFKTAKSARGRLSELGYLPVHLCGQQLLRHPLPHPAGDRHVRAHWRRGHWRRQVYGEGRALRKLIWVMPIVVGASDDAEPLGHLYLVS